MMILHLYYKEWLKIRWSILASVVLGVAIVIYIFLNVDNGVRMNGGFNYLMKVLYGIPQENYYRTWIMYVPLLVALCVGLPQYIPEVLDKRIKLTLHLPINNTKALYHMVLFGFFSLIITYLVVFGLFFVLNNRYFPFEESMAVLLSMTPWLLGGIATYFMIAMIALEPNLLYQILYSIVTYYLVKQFFVGYEHADTRNLIPILAVLAFTPCMGLLFTSDRFIKGLR